MKDALDADGIWAAIRDAGLELPDRPHPSDLDGRLVNVFLKCEASRDGMVRGRRNAMLDDSDVHWHRQIKACVGGVAAAVTGDPAVFVSVSAAHQGPDGGGPVAAIVDLGVTGGAGLGRPPAAGGRPGRRGSRGRRTRCRARSPRAWRPDPGRTVLSTLEGDAVERGRAGGAHRRRRGGATPAAGLGPGRPGALLGRHQRRDGGGLRRGAAGRADRGAGEPGLLAGRAGRPWPRRPRPALAVLDDPGRLGRPGPRDARRRWPACRAPGTRAWCSTPRPAERHRADHLHLGHDRDSPRACRCPTATCSPARTPCGSPGAGRRTTRWRCACRCSTCTGSGVGLHGTLVTGAGATLIPRFEPAAVAAAAIDGGATLLFGVPTMYHRLADSPALADAGPAAAGGERLGPAAGRAARGGPGRQRAGRARALRHDRDRDAGVQPVRRASAAPARSASRCPGCELRLAPREGGTAEIQVRGPNVHHRATWTTRRPPRRRSPRTVGSAPATWARSTTTATCAISGRAKELIITGGYNVYPREVEEVLRAPPRRRRRGRGRGAVGPVGRDGGGLRGAGAVGAGGAGRRTGRRGARRHLVSYKRPREWRLVEAIPRNALGKILRHELRVG